MTPTTTTSITSMPGSAGEMRSCGGGHHGKSCSRSQPCGNAATRAAALAAACGADSEQPITILLVDDDPDCRTLVRDAIAESKVHNRVFEVTNGQEALDFLHGRGKYEGQPKPGLIFLDIEMPGMTGQEALREIKSDPSFRNIPVVMMTGVSDESQMKAAAEAGANSYTIKPANAEQFLRTVLASTNYWLTIHQYPNHHLPSNACRR